MRNMQSNNLRLRTFFPASIFRKLNSLHIALLDILAWGYKRIDQKLTNLGTTTSLCLLAKMLTGLPTDSVNKLTCQI